MTPKRLLFFISTVVFLLAWAPGIFGRSGGEDCLACHSDKALKSKAGHPVSVDAAVLAASIHGQAGFGCVDCHAALSGVIDFPHPVPLPRADCSGCHGDVAGLVRQSVHGGTRDLPAGRTVPSCPDCHGYHAIVGARDPASPVRAMGIPAVCGRCHRDQSLSRRSGFLTSWLEKSAASFHGIALSFGETRVAQCASCHGHHDIRSSADPRSPVHPANLPATCRACHPGAGTHVVQGKIHVRSGRRGYPGPVAARLIYSAATGLLLAAFAAFLGSDLRRRWRER